MRAIELAQRIVGGARRAGNWLQFLKFGVVGGIGYVINLAVFGLLVKEIGLQHTAAAVLAFAVAVSNNFLWNRYWTFDGAGGPAAFQGARFLLVSLASLMINLSALQVLVSGAGLALIPAQAIAVAVAMPFNFFGNKLWAFAAPAAAPSTSRR